MYNRNKMIDNRTHLFDMVSYCMHVWVFYIRKCGVYYNKLFNSTFHLNVQGPTVLLSMTTVIVKSNQRK